MDCSENNKVLGVAPYDKTEAFLMANHPGKTSLRPCGSKKKSWIIGVGGVLAIVVGAFLIYYFVIRGDETTEPATSKPNVWPCQQFNENNYVCHIPRNGKPVTNEEFVQGLAKANQSLIDELNGIIRDFKFADGLFFESKPFDSKTLKEPYEFALVGTGVGFFRD